VCQIHSLTFPQNEPFQFSHYIVIARTYKLSAEDEVELTHLTDPPSKKSKQFKPRLGNAFGTGGVYSFHPEDEVIQKVRSASCIISLFNLPLKVFVFYTRFPLNKDSAQGEGCFWSRCEGTYDVDSCRELPSDGTSDAGGVWNRANSKEMTQ
jgi:BCCIP